MAHITKFHLFPPHICIVTALKEAPGTLKLSLKCSHHIYRGESLENKQPHYERLCPFCDAAIELETQSSCICRCSSFHVRDSKLFKIELEIPKESSTSRTFGIANWCFEQIIIVRLHKQFDIQYEKGSDFEKFLSTLDSNTTHNAKSFLCSRQTCHCLIWLVRKGL